MTNANRFLAIVDQHVGFTPIRERTALNVGGIGLICLTYRVRTEVGCWGANEQKTGIRTRKVKNLVQNSFSSRWR
jgi:hypothetical protein